MKILTGALAFSLLAGCGSGGALSGKLRDTQVVHSADASRIWLVESNPLGPDYVMMCDTALLAKGLLCVRDTAPTSPPALAPVRVETTPPKAANDPGTRPTGRPAPSSPLERE